MCWSRRELRRMGWRSLRHEIIKNNVQKIDAEIQVFIKIERRTLERPFLHMM